MSHDSCTLPPSLVVMHPSMLVRNSSVLSRGSVAECGKRAPQPWLTHRTQQGTRSSALQHAAMSRTGRTGVVIVDHGSRKRDSNEMLQVTGAEIVEVAHMEIAEPTIEQAVGEQRTGRATVFCGVEEYGLPATHGPVDYGMMPVAHSTKLTTPRFPLSMMAALLTCYPRLSSSIPGHHPYPAGSRCIHPALALTVTTLLARSFPGRCAAAGADTVVVAPYFLSRGRHIQV
ncbi:cbiX domain-containing protein [Haematococcus lacustris]|uniref:CbiX domain-containing protein n=1 Tax=Haematococcus lacustris TaxID=44745 RepID=A0A699ZV11_HAELA|nr:cbiX domain-containing protein [Haematococcus lacustris]